MVDITMKGEARLHGEPITGADIVLWTVNHFEGSCYFWGWEDGEEVLVVRDYDGLNLLRTIKTADELTAALPFMFRRTHGETAFSAWEIKREHVGEALRRGWLSVA